MIKIGRIINNEYEYEYMPSHPRCKRRPYIAVHVIIMEEYLGRLLNKDEVVHHINGDKLDNRIENLQLLTNKEHVALHKRDPRYIELMCASCNKLFQKRYNEYTTKFNRGQKDFYCNRHCMGKHFGRSRIKTD